MGSGSTIICKECRSTVSISNVRYHRNGRDLICIPCYGRLPKHELPQPAVARDRFMCMRCNYRFSMKKDTRAARRCPYCASENIELHETVTAPRILKEVCDNPQFAYPF